jgi:spermidine synthase
MGHLPLLLAPEAESALFLGVGTGATLGAVTHYPLETVDAVELVPGVLRALPWFAEVNEGVDESSRVHFHTADARRFVHAAERSYDLIVGDLFHPGRDGAGNLYSLEHFQAVAKRLSPRGLYAQWIPLYQFDVANLKTVVRTFLAVFPETHSFQGLYSAENPALVLLGSASPSTGGGPWPLSLAELESRLQEPEYRRWGLNDARDLLGAYMLDRRALAELAGPGPLNTDLHPRVLFEAPPSAYEKRRELAWSSLEALLPLRSSLPAGLLEVKEGRRARVEGTVALFSKALGHYLEGDIRRVENEGKANPRAVEAYLLAFETAPEFAPAKGMLLYLASVNPRVADTVLGRMLQRSPGDPQIRRALEAHQERQGARGPRPESIAGKV